ncbi:hypothetical protein P7C70_g4157, partial [Phenoliferia sp. Uapishka_3]
MDFFYQPAVVPYRLVLVFATALGLHGYRSGSLSKSGAVAAAFLGYCTLANPLKVFGVSLLVFYFAGSKITKIKAAYKATLEAPEASPSSTTPTKPGGNRSAAQVACNALVGAICAVAWRILYSGEVKTVGDGVGSVWAREQWCVLDRQGSQWSRPLVITAVAFWSACSGDTFASELGILSRTPPKLITTFREVPPGTNGGISALGTLLSINGGLLVGTAAALVISLEDTLCNRFEVWTTLLLVGSVSGFLGSGIDSLLGATLQETLYSKKRKMVVHSRQKNKKSDDEDDSIESIAGYPILSNNSVNLLSSGVTAVAAFWWASR